MPADSIDRSKSTPVAHYKLKDYLGPNGKYPYDSLPEELENMRREGYVVYVWSVPGFMMVAGHPDTEDYKPEYPWHGNREYYKTAKDCIAIKNGIPEDTH